MIATITDAQSNVTSYARESRGNRASVTDQAGNVTTCTYDAGDRLKTITYRPAQSIQGRPHVHLNRKLPKYLRCPESPSSEEAESLRNAPAHELISLTSKSTDSGQ